MNTAGNYIYQLGEIFSDNKEIQPQILLATFVVENLGNDLDLFIEQIQSSSLQQEIKDAIIEELTQP